MYIVDRSYNRVFVVSAVRRALYLALRANGDVVGRCPVAEAEGAGNFLIVGNGRPGRCVASGSSDTASSW